MINLYNGLEKLKNNEWVKTKLKIESLLKENLI